MSELMNAVDALIDAEVQRIVARKRVEDLVYGADSLRDVVRAQVVEKAPSPPPLRLGRHKPNPTGADMSDEPPAVREGSVKQQILDKLNGEPGRLFTKLDLDGISSTGAVLGAALFELARDGLILRPKRGVYRSKAS
jgi:hypothetical protein